MKKEMKIVFLMVSCLMALCLLVLQSPTIVKAQCDILPEFKGPFPYPTTPISPWPPAGQCPNFWHGFVSDPKDMGFPIPQGVCLDGEWRDDPISIEYDVPIPMRDGVKLAANVYRPNKPGEKYPVIMTFGGTKGKDVFGTGKTWGVYTHKFSDQTTFEGPDPGFFVPEGYIVIMVDSRGYGKSEGCRLGDRSGEDYYDAIEWAGTQEWSNGNVGMIGVSALGNVQWYAAQLRPPHLKAIVPWEAGGAALYFRRFGGIDDCTFLPTMGGRVPPYPDKDKCTGVAAPPSKLVLENITVPVLACVSSSDQFVHAPGTDWGWRHVSSKQKWLYNHGGQKWGRFYGTDGQAFQLMFFNHFLKGNDDRILRTPRVRYEVRETLDKFHVRYADNWPIPQTQYKKMYLDARTRTLTFQKVQRTGKVSYDSTISQTRVEDKNYFNNERFMPVPEHDTISTVVEGRAVFDYKFDRDTELTGHMKLKVWVSADSSDDTALFVTVKKFDRSGNEVFFDCSDSSRRLPVALGWLKLSRRQLDPKLSTPYQPILSFAVEEKVKPGEIVPGEIAIVLSSTLFRKGETLRLIISGDSQVYSTRHHFKNLNKGMCSIHSGGKYDSYLQIPVIPPK
jgi:predicted acyl esterase